MTWFKIKKKQSVEKTLQIGFYLLVKSPRFEN